MSTTSGHHNPEGPVSINQTIYLYCLIDQLPYNNDQIFTQAMDTMLLFTTNGGLDHTQAEAKCNCVYTKGNLMDP